MLGKFEQSIEDGKKAVALDPHFPPGHNNLAWAYIQLNRLTEAEEALKQAAGYNVAFPEFLVMRYYIAYLRGDQAGMKREAAQSEKDADVGDWIIHAESSVLAYSGHLLQARIMTRRAVDMEKQAHQPERAAIYEAGAAVREAFFGNVPEARQRARAALDLSKGRDAEYGAAFALALSGNFSESQPLANDLEKRFPEDTCVNFADLPILRALAALNRGDSAAALASLQVAAPYDLAIPCSGFGYFGNLYAPYVRGQAYLKANRYADAIAEFRKILDHPGIVFTDPVRVAAHLQLGRALLGSGDPAKAKAAFGELLSLWKDADPDIPLLQQAKAEYGRI